MPRLIVVPTPIGNLEDITLRALRTLHEVALVLAEDTRHTRHLFKHHGVSTRLLSYHRHNEMRRMEAVFETLAHADVALVSDAGTPTLSDPGADLVRAAVERGIEVDVLPGPSAVTTAVVGAALSSPGFLFYGFLPRKSGERRAELAELAGVPQAIVFFEAPHRIEPALQDVVAVLGDRQIVIARELSKLHQEYIRGTVSEVLDRFQSLPPRGELTVVVAGASPVPVTPPTENLLAEVRERRRRGEGRDTVISEVRRMHGISRNDAYALWLSAVTDHQADVENE